MRYFFIILFCFANSAAFSCTCGGIYKLTKKIYKDASDVFIGRLISSDALDEDRLKLTFEVERNLIKNDKREIISIVTTTSNCSLGASLGERWFVFAHDNYVDQCGRSHHLNQIISKDYGMEAYNWAKDRYDASQKSYEEELGMIEQFLKE